jgi:hypothetical protein
MTLAAFATPAALPGPAAEPYEGADDLHACHDALLRQLDQRIASAADESAERDALVALAPELKTFLARGAATGLVLDEISERTTCQTLLDYWSAALRRAGQAAERARLLAFDAEQLPVLDDAACPYVGLQAFRTPEFFFGREQDIDDLLQQLEHSPLLVVAGGSGSGKSSLVLAGMLPRLAEQRPARWRSVPPFSPGRHPFQQLCDALSSATGAGFDPAELSAQPEALSQRLAGDPTLLVIDQFEELFTLTAEAERQSFVAALAAFMAGGKHRLLVTLREEFRSRLVELRALDGLLDHAWYSMRPMSYEELKQAIELPAARVNLRFHASVVDDLAKKVLGQPTALPLLQFTLRKLWQGRQRNRITQDVYRQVGDPLNALQADADAFVSKQPQQTVEEIRRILISLVHVTELLEAYRMPMLKSELTAAGKANTESVLELLDRHDYLCVTPTHAGDDAIVEIQHEALIRNWPRLVGWINDRRAQLRERVALAEAARHWEVDGRREQHLLTKWQVARAQEQPDLGPLEQAFIVASMDALDREQREREAQAAAGARAESERKRTRDKLFWGGAVFLLAGAVVSLTVALMVREAYHARERAQSTAEFALRKQLEAMALVQNFEEQRSQLRQFAKQLGTSDAAAEEHVTQLAQQLESLTPRTVSKGRPTAYLHITSEGQREAAERIAAALRRAAFETAAVDLVPLGNEAVPNDQALVRFFDAKDVSQAQAIVEVLRRYAVPAEAKFVANQEDVPPGRLMVWFTRGDLGPRGLELKKK